MRCPVCSEECPEAALICGLCRHVFKPQPPRSRIARYGHARRPIPLAVRVVAAATAVVVIPCLSLVLPRLLSSRAASAPSTPPLTFDQPAPSSPSKSFAVTRVRRTIPMAAPPPLIEEPAPAQPEPPAVSYFWHEGARGHRQALDEQARTGAPLLVYFRAGWSAECRRLEKEIFAAPAAVTLLSRLVKVKLDVQGTPEEQAMVEEYGVGGLPGLLLVRRPGAAPAKVQAFAGDGPDSASARAGMLAAAVRSVRVEEARPLMDEGMAKLNAGDPMAARGLADRTIALGLGLADAHLLRAMAELRLGHPGRALGDVRRAIELTPNDPQSYAVLASIYRDAGMDQDAVLVLHRLVQLAPRWNQGAAYLARGDALAALGDSARARSDWQEACRQGNGIACAAAQ